jgi:hypothetical protein
MAIFHELFVKFLYIHEFLSIATSYLPSILYIYYEIPR